MSDSPAHRRSYGAVDNYDIALVRFKEPIAGVEIVFGPSCLRPPALFDDDAIATRRDGTCGLRRPILIYRADAPRCRASPTPPSRFQFGCETAPAG